MITFADVASWKAAPLGTAGDGLKKQLDTLEKARDAVEQQSVPDSWFAPSAFLARIRRSALVRRMDRHLEDGREMQRALYDAEGLVTTIEQWVIDAQNAARTGGYEIAGDGSVTDTHKPPADLNPLELLDWLFDRQSGAQAIADDVTEILAKAAAADATLVKAFPAGTDDSIDERGTPSPEVAEYWAQLTDEERMAIIEEQIEELAKEAGIDDPPITWGHLGNTNGSWTGDGVNLNIDNLDDPDILHTVAHELRHARQDEAIDDKNDVVHWPWDDPFDMHEEDGITEEQVEGWEEEQGDNYIDPDDDYEGYYNQDVERDAREAGRNYLNDLTTEELERLLEEGQ